MRPLADMTEEERGQFRGAWCEDIYGDLYIYLGHTPGGTTHDEETGAPMGAFIDTRQAGLIEAPLAAFASRLDLPRAWQADGQPPAGEWEHAEYLGDYKGMTDVYHFDGEPTHRRWVGSWEEA